MYIYTYAYMHMSKVLYQNAVFERGIDVAGLFSGMVLSAFCQSSSNIHDIIMYLVSSVLFLRAKISNKTSSYENIYLVYFNQNLV